MNQKLVMSPMRQLVPTLRKVYHLLHSSGEPDLLDFYKSYLEYIEGGLKYGEINQQEHDELKADAFKHLQELLQIQENKFTLTHECDIINHQLKPVGKNDQDDRTKVPQAD